MMGHIINTFILVHDEKNGVYEMREKDSVDDTRLHFPRHFTFTSTSLLFFYTFFLSFNTVARISQHAGYRIKPRHTSLVQKKDKRAHNSTAARYWAGILLISLSIIFSFSHFLGGWNPFGGHSLATERLGALYYQIPIPFDRLASSSPRSRAHYNHPRRCESPTKSYVLVVVAGWRQVLEGADAFLLVPRVADEQGLGVLQHKDHAAPLGLGGVAPAVHGGALDADVAPLHEVLLAAVEDGDDGALDDYAVVEGLGAVHDGVGAGAKVYVAKDGAAGEGEAGGPAGHAFAAGLK